MQIIELLYSKTLILYPLAVVSVIVFTMFLSKVIKVGGKARVYFLKGLFILAFVPYVNYAVMWFCWVWCVAIIIKSSITGFIYLWKQLDNHG